jgi:alanine dehydrogenase
LHEDAGLRGGLSVATGAVTHSAVAEALGLPFTDAGDVLA